MLCKYYWIVLYTVHFTAFCLVFFRTRCIWLFLTPYLSMRHESTKTSNRQYFGTLVGNPCVWSLNPMEFVIIRVKQESHAVERKPRDPAAVLFRLKFADDIHYKFKSI